ncbi:MAG: aminopeptidase P family protein [Candidatus Heimdallarchaeota archaeon]|nr:aminopeptidase P family protein [Candidatus Heimdallarchaeota archaeon]
MNKVKTPKDVLLSIVSEKHELVSAVMSELGIECWITFVRETDANPDPVQNLVIGGEIVWESAFIFFKKHEFKKIAIVGNFDADAEKNKSVWDEVIDYTEGITAVLREKITELNPKNIALNYSDDDVMADGLSHGMFVKLSSILKDFADRFMSSRNLVQKVRSRKTATEIELITSAAVLTEKINHTMTTKFTRDMTEKEIQIMFHQIMDTEGVAESWQRNSCPAVDAGPDKQFGHVGPSQYKIKNGHSLHNDFGVKLHGYCSDIQRMWFFGKDEEIPLELLHAFKTVREAIFKASKYIKPGVTGNSVDKVARNHVISQGYEPYQHALGHQIGTKAHDGGVLLGPLWEKYGELPNGLVEAGNIFTLELYVATKSYGMVSLEEMILVTDTGCEFIVPRQEKWICVEL